MLSAQDTLDAIGQLQDSELDLADAAIHLGRMDTPDADWQRARRYLTELAQEAAALPGAGESGKLNGRAHALALLLAGRHGFRGDMESYDAPENANLIAVTERRRGLPVALGILWLHCAQVAGWDAHGIDFPGHFLIALTEGHPAQRHSGRQVVVDPFAGGRALGLEELRGLARRIEGPDAILRPGLLRPMTSREILLRLQNNIRGRRMQANDMPGALSCIETMLRIAPDAPGLWQERAQLHEVLDQPRGAIAAWERFLSLVPDGDVAERARASLDVLRAKFN